MHKIARCLPLSLVGISFRSRVYKVPTGSCTCVQSRQGCVRTVCSRALTMHVLGIDETTAHALLHIDKVKFYDAGNETPVLLIKILSGALLGCQFQINTRCQGHLVVTITVVALTVVMMEPLPAIEGLTVVLGTISACIDVIGGTHATCSHVTMSR